MRINGHLVSTCPYAEMYYTPAQMLASRMLTAVAGGLRGWLDGLDRLRAIQGRLAENEQEGRCVADRIVAGFEEA